MTFNRLVNKLNFEIKMGSVDGVFAGCVEVNVCEGVDYVVEG